MRIYVLIHFCLHFYTYIYIYIYVNIKIHPAIHTEVYTRVHNSRLVPEGERGQQTPQQPPSPPPPLLRADTLYSGRVSLGDTHTHTESVAVCTPARTEGGVASERKWETESERLIPEQLTVHWNSWREACRPSVMLCLVCAPARARAPKRLAAARRLWRAVWPSFRRRERGTEGQQGERHALWASSNF